MQTDATLLDVTCCVRLHTLLHVVGCCCAKFETGQTFQPTTPNISFVPWSPKRSATMLDPFAHCGLQRLMGCILPTMHCRSQTWWELLHPFAHHCQHARNNFQHCWRNNVGGCCVCTEPNMRKELYTNMAADSLFCTQIWPPWRHVKTGNQEIE